MLKQAPGDPIQPRREPSLKVVVTRYERVEFCPKREKLVFSAKAAYCVYLWNGDEGAISRSAMRRFGVFRLPSRL